MEPRKAVVRMMVDFAESFPGFTPTAVMMATWDRYLGAYSDAQIDAACRMVVRTHTFGPPAIAHVIEAIEGRVTTVRVPVLDNYNRIVLREDFTPAYKTEERRVWPDGSSAPAALPRRLANAEWNGGTRAFGDGLDETMKELGL